MGIKSYQGPRAEFKNEYKAPILVEDYMTKSLITFHPNQSILEVMELLIRYRISGGPVVNDDGDLVGIISEADCMKEISESRYFNMPILDKRVSHFMSEEVETIGHDVSIFDAASKFNKSNRRRLPVMEHGKLVGQISRKDILAAALKLKAFSWRR
ncbi:CBS domain-containing protein [Robertkochia marina]|uniref:CBS domain-containing protein n=1 Tax=Robertkochia marina TaxID=1227945 RepID=A0A4S3M3J8_9FLAO|nr:CBS domain-containing protein [Robertkochia marina]THD69686.1 CBS domain-containing protein [Robertkochia marina]TRZ46968.1 CBS domain-containing protein [Robertkochia marina]